MLDASALKASIVWFCRDDVSEDIMYRAFDLTNQEAIARREGSFGHLHSRPFILLTALHQQ